MKRFLVMPLLLLGTLSTAQTVDQDVALQKAINFMNLQKRAKGGMVDQPQFVLAHKAANLDETYYYVFNNTDGGFVIIGGDETAEEVLGYSDCGSFDVNNVPDNLQWWLSTYEEQIGRSIHAQRANEEMKPVQREASTSWSAISPMLKTEWDQSMPFNAMIPGNDLSLPYNDQYMTGCVATAAAQIMKYHKYPQKGWSSRSYSANGCTYEANFAETTYNWDKMKNTYEYKYTGSTEEKEVAKLMYHIGAAVCMEYNTAGHGGSSAATSTAAQALRKFFGYSEATIVNRESDGMTDQQWESKVYDEISHGRPVLYSGRSAQNAGHAFVCDGYQNGRFHINWGWRGSYNGYFLLTATSSEPALTPEGTGSGGGAAGSSYVNKQYIIAGLKPDKNYAGGVTCTKIVNWNGGNFIAGNDFKLIFEMENTSSKEVTIDPTVYFYPADGGGSLGYIDNGPKVTIPAKSKYNLELSNNRNLTLFTAGKEYMIQFYDYQVESYLLTTIKICAPLSSSITLGSEGWGTLCLPYDAEIPSGLKVYEVKGVNNKDMLIYYKTDKIEINKAYLIGGTPGTYSFFGPDTEQGVYRNGLLYGVTKKTGDYVPMGAYVLKNQSEGVGFYKVTQMYSVRANRYQAYLQTESTAGSRIVIGSESGINNIQMDDDDQSTILNILGHRSQSASGLMIKNGKLIFVK